MSGKKNFNKVLNGGDIIVTAFGAMIGWGWVVSSGNWLQNAGAVGTALGFLLAGVMIFFVALTYAELTSAMPKCGGEHVFSFKAFGPIGSFICTWALILSYVGVVCFEAVSLPTVMQYLFPGFLKGYMYTIAGFDVYATWLVVAVGSALLITLVNLKGVKTAAVVQTILTLVIAGAGILLVVGSAINGSPSNLDGQVLVGDGFWGTSRNILAVAAVAPFFLMGFDVIPHVAEEIRVPLKKTGKLMLLSIVLAVGFYMMVVLAMGFAMNRADVAASVEGSGLAAADAMAKAFRSDVMVKVLIIGGICGIITSWNSFVIGGSRAIYSMAEAHMIPHCFAKISGKSKTPVYAILLIGILSAITPFFGRKMLVWVSDAASFACCIAYCMVALSFIIIRKKEPDLLRPYKVKHYMFVGIIAVVTSGFMVLMYLIPGFGATLLPQEWVIVGGWTLLGVIFAVVSKKRYGDKFGDVRFDEEEKEASDAE